MFDRLKSLPLTILLTILIWMYAESQVNSTRAEAKLTVKDIPVWVSGPPSVLAANDITVEPKTVEVTVVGTPDLIDTLNQRATTGGQSTGIHAFVDLTPDDKPAPGVVSYRSPRIVTPAGLTLLQAPERVGFRMVASATTKPETKPDK
jgi:hypothetical protein